MNTVSFVQFEGQWRVKGPKAMLVPFNGEIAVTKRDGSTTKVIVVEVLWSDDTTAIAMFTRRRGNPGSWRVRGRR